MENAADASGSMTEITLGGHAEHGRHSGPTFGLHRFCLHRSALQSFLLRRWPLILLPPFRRFRFSRLHVLLLAPPLPLVLPLLLHLDVRLRLWLQHPQSGSGLQLMVVFVGVMVVVVGLDRAREMGVPKRGWQTQLGCAPSVFVICCHLQRKHTERGLLPLEAGPE